jgi:hypothetical protein
MNPKSTLLLLVIAAVLGLASCSGSNNKCTTNCATGNASVSITLFDTPPSGVTVLSFSLPIVGISLTPSTGSAVPIYSPTTIVPTEITRLQAESALITLGAQVPAGTYTSLNVTLAASSGVFINYSGSTIAVSSSLSCPNGGVCNLPTGAAATINIPISLTLTSGQNAWIGIDVNLNNAITSPTTASIGVDFTQPKTFTAITTPRAGTPSGAFDTIGDFIGTVTALSSSSITVQNTITGQSLTAAVNASTELDAAPGTYSNCTSAATCVTKGAVVSMDSALTTSNALTATEIDTLDATAIDEVEGVIYPTSTTSTTGVHGLIISDKISASGNSTLGASTTTLGTGIFLSAGSNINFVIDTKNLTAFVQPIGFAGSGDLLAGQQIRAHVSNVTTTTSGSNTVIQADATNVLLRWSRISASINSVALNNFTITGLPQYITTINSPITPAAVFTYQGGTLFDGVTGTSDPNFVVGSPVAIRALFLNSNAPAFQAAKVRVP